MTIQRLSSRITVYSSISKTPLINSQQTTKMKAKIRDDLKAGGTFVKKMEVVITKDGPRINLIR